jgi:hypothetical protein
MAFENPYFNNDNPAILQSYCSYMDILGFRRNMQHAFQNGNANKMLGDLMDMLKDDINPLSPEQHWDSPFRYWLKIFTDNVVFGLPIFKESDGEAELYQAIVRLSSFQLIMANKGYFIRGGFTAGPLHLSDNIAFGTALIDAYNLEDCKAVNPRIIVSEQMSIRLREYIKKRPISDDSNLQHFILIDTDGFLFLNYLGLICQRDVEDDALDLLREHKRRVEACLGEFAHEPHIRSKYEWVARYHNYFCEINDKCIGDVKEFLIPIDSISLKPAAI